MTADAIVRDFAVAVALAMVLEGVAYALFPEAMKRMLAQMLVLPPQVLRMAGTGAAVLGVLVVGVLRSRW